MEETRLLRTLRAVRRFSDREIPAEVLRDILEAGRWTGSSKNSQPWELVVVGDRGTLARLARLGRYADHLAGAQLAIALVMASGSPSNEFDKGRLAQNLMLAAWAHGVGSCVASLYPEGNQRQARDLLGVPADRNLRTLLSLGYPADESARRVPPGMRSLIPSGRRPLEELVSWDRYGRRRSDR